jgi:D-glycero-D-manno-heptose 1,7-bisphosphate phosphatase
MNKAVFLDRDGTINVDVNYLTNKEDLVILPGVKEALSRLKELGFLNIVVTNQSAIARGYITEEGLLEIHEEMDNVLSNNGVSLIDKYYYSPFHIDGVVEEYAKESEDRKPGIGMINKAVKEFDIKLDESFMVGDSLVDMQCAESAGLKKILVKSGYGTKTEKECINYGITVDYCAENLLDAVSFIEKLVNIKLI